MDAKAYSVAGTDRGSLHNEKAKQMRWSFKVWVVKEEGQGRRCRRQTIPPLLHLASMHHYGHHSTVENTYIISTSWDIPRFGPIPHHTITLVWQRSQYPVPSHIFSIRNSGIVPSFH